MTALISNNIFCVGTRPAGRLSDIGVINIKKMICIYLLGASFIVVEVTLAPRMRNTSLQVHVIVINKTSSIYMVAY